LYKTSYYFLLKFLLDCQGGFVSASVNS